MARRKIRKKHALPGDSMKFSKAPGDKISPTTTSSCKRERLSNTLVPKEHSDYDSMSPEMLRLLQEPGRNVESLSHET